MALGECEAGPITIVASTTSYRVSSGRFRNVLVRRRGNLAVGSLLGSHTKAVDAGTARRGPCRQRYAWGVTRLKMAGYGSSRADGAPEWRAERAFGELRYQAGPIGD
ncbi:hypothetical protein [Candidatus Methylomirabilis sp.]|uniref:hypothetical protein n=1 Tax=Candidatus Methylomirabilis sp. TaxID=2032687 RepID=UPI002A68DB31|nr:hypothetical protein [Candidatus Methylomirabilis sp.]